MKFLLKELLRRPMSIDAACCCSKGRVRAVNEDNYYFDGRYASSGGAGYEGILRTSIRMPDLSAQKGRLFAVFDGLGGSDYGDAASYASAVAASDYLNVRGNMDVSDIRSSLDALYRHMDRAVSRKAKALGTGDMGSTAVSAYFFADHVWCSNAGDSRCYLFRDGELSLLSKAHTGEEFLMMFGLGGSKPPLTQYLGAGSVSRPLVPSHNDAAVQRGDLYLLCSDGLTDMLSDHRIEKILNASRDPEEAAGILAEAANERGGRDNFTVIVMQVS